MRFIFYLLSLRLVRGVDEQHFEMKRADVGENVTLTCEREQSGEPTMFYWIRFVPGSPPDVVGVIYYFNFKAPNKSSHFICEQGPGTILLHILSVTPHDAGFYYCIKTTYTTAKSVIQSDRFDRNPTCFLSYFNFSGTEPDVKAVIQVPPSDSVRSVTLQCSVLSDSENTTCRTERNVCWFQSGPDASYPSVFAAHGGSQDGCQGGVRGGAPQKWESSSSELLGSSDAGPFSCAVATCGEFFFGTLNFRTAGVLDENTILVVLLAAALVASVIVNVCLVWILKGKSSSCCEGTFLIFFKEFKNAKEEMCYSAPVFTRSKAQPDRGRLKDKETVYSEVRTPVTGN
uniref:Ig-like domain-containing protein n=1 Tax=Takifugu rubripes TaxID=31033 RepID=A0A674N2G3_TAKRU